MNNKVESLRGSLIDIMLKHCAGFGATEPLDVIADMLMRQCAEVARKAIENEPFDLSSSEFPYRREHQEEGVNIAIKAINKAFGVSD